MSGDSQVVEAKRLKAQVAALEQLLEVYEQTALEQANRLEEALRLHADTIKQLSAPLLPVQDNILVMPLIGHIDHVRGTQIMEKLLNGVQMYQANFLIIDITGVPIVDAAVANHLIQATQAVTLLGAQCVLVGITPEVAQTLVQLDIDLRRVATRSNLQAGIAYATARLPEALWQKR